MNLHNPKLSAGAAVMVLALGAHGGVAFAQIRAVMAPQTSTAAAPPISTPSEARIPEGTEVEVELREKLSSATSAEGDEFSVITDEEITLPDGTILPAGYTGKGEVTGVSKAGMVGKSGQLNIRLDYIKIGSKHVRLRANKGGEGKSGVTNMVVTTVLIGPLGLLVRGHSIVYMPGTKLKAYVDEDAAIGLPVAAPPKLD